MRALGNKTAKLDFPAIMSITIFERPEDDPEEVPDSDQDNGAPEVRSRSAESLKAEALTPEHMFTHRPRTLTARFVKELRCSLPTLESAVDHQQSQVTRLATTSQVTMSSLEIFGTMGWRTKRLCLW